MNWGHNIIVAFTLFAGFIGYLAYKSFQQNVDLVAEDYYLQEIQYQDQIEKIKNTKAARQVVTFSQENNNLIVQFPNGANAVNGTIILFCPSDARFDQNVAIALNDQLQQVIPTDQVVKGYYRVKVDWKSGEQAYFTEESVYIY